MIEEVFGTPQERLMEPMVDDQLGEFKKINMSVGKTPMAAFWRTNNDEFYQPQTQLEHNDLLNTYWPQRETTPNWKELGVEEEQKSPHYNSKDEAFRGGERAESSLVENIEYDPNTNKATITMNGRAYEYNATPDQLKRFMNAGSLGKEINNIKNGHGTSMMKAYSPNVKRISVPTINIFGGR